MTRCEAMWLGVYDRGSDRAAGTEIIQSVMAERVCMVPVVFDRMQRAQYCASEFNLSFGTFSDAAGYPPAHERCVDCTADRCTQDRALFESQSRRRASITRELCTRQDPTVTRAEGYGGARKAMVDGCKTYQRRPGRKVLLRLPLKSAMHIDKSYQHCCRSKR